MTETGYDASVRQTSRSVTTLASGFDGAVRRIETAYDSLGRRTTVTQLDAVTSGTITDEVAFEYDGWSNVSKFEQDVNSAVGASGSVDDYEVSHTYVKATSGRKSVRRTSTTLLSGNVLTYEYQSAVGLLDDDLSRVTNIKDGATVLARYAYIGVADLVRTAYSSIGLQNEAYDSGGAYTRLDRFNRRTKFAWEKPNGYKAYDVDLAWDRAGNITSVVDHVHTGFDNVYDIDDLDRVTRAHQGTIAGGSITSATQDQQWTLDQLGNWDENRLDLDGDGTFTGTDELDEDRSHNDVNEIVARDIDGDSTDDFTLVYDAVGQLTDDGEEYKYVWDAFGRMRKILDRSDDSLVEELKYNGLGFMIGEHYDADEDLDVDSNDPWYWHAFDERWRQVATFRAGDSDPKEEWVCQQAGLDGRGGSSFINGIVLRDRDENSGWTSASDGTMEQRFFYSQNWRGDVVALTSYTGKQVEQVRYSAYGVPFGLPGGDLDRDGNCDSADRTALEALVAMTGYSSAGDLDTDGDCDTTDLGLFDANYDGSVLGVGNLSNVSSCRADQASILFAHGCIQGLRIDRFRIRSSVLGGWKSRDPLEYYDAANQYQYCRSQPLRSNDTMGLMSIASQIPQSQPTQVSGPDANCRPGEVITLNSCGPIICVHTGELALLCIESKFKCVTNQSRI